MLVLAKKRAAVSKGCKTPQKRVKKDSDDDNDDDDDRKIKKASRTGKTLLINGKKPSSKNVTKRSSGMDNLI